MNFPLTLKSAIEKLVVLAAFLPLLTMVYPETVAVAYASQTPGKNDLVFEVNSKQTFNQPTIQTIPEEENPTLTNPCYPGAVGSCNANVQLPAKQPAIATNLSDDYIGPAYSKEQVEALIVAYSEHYGIDPQTPKCIAFYESGYNQFSKNKRSTASGVFQYLHSTWKHTDEGKAGYSVFDAEANVKAAVKYMAVHKKTNPWVVRGKCPALSFVK